MEYIQILIIPILMLSAFYLTLCSNRLQLKGYSKHIVYGSDDLNDPFANNENYSSFINISYLASVLLLGLFLFWVYYRFDGSYPFKLGYGIVLMVFLRANAICLNNIFIFRFVRDNPGEIEGQITQSAKYLLTRCLINDLAFIVVIAPFAILSESFYLYGALIGSVIFPVIHLRLYRKDKKNKETSSNSATSGSKADLLLKKLMMLILIVSIAYLAAYEGYRIYQNKTYAKEEIDVAFAPITSKYGIKIVYEIGDDFFSPVENSLVPAGPPRDSKVDPIRHRVLLHYPAFLQKAFEKYPIGVIQKYLNAIYFADDIDSDGFKFGGTYDPFRKIIYLVDNGAKNDEQAMRTFHHEFSSLLLNSRSFWLDPWMAHNPKDFVYLIEKYHSWKILKNEVDISKEGSVEDYGKGFMRAYGRTDFENDFNEYSAMIFTYPKKFKKIMDKYPRVRGKFLVWLDFYQSIDPIFTEEYLFGGPEAPVTSEAVLREPLEKGESPERTIEQAIVKSGAMEQIKGKLESFILDEIIPQYGKDVNSAIECLMKIAEDDITVFPSDGLAEPTTGKSTPGNMKCISNGALGEVPGDRVKFDFHLYRSKTASVVVEGGDICKSHSNPSVIAQYALGTAYYFGRAKPQDYTKALNWYMKASQNGFPLADNSLGAMYCRGDGVTKSYKEAFIFYRKAADHGLSIAQNNLGDMYFSGRYVEQDYAEALKWYRKAAEQGYPSAQYNLGTMYDKGYGVQANETEAIKWYRKAAERNSADAQYMLGYFYANQDRLTYDFNEAFKWFRKSAENGHMFSQTRLGIMFQLGRGTEQNPAEAAKWYRAAADQGDPEAMAFLGYLYEHGMGVSRDTNKAKDFYLAAAQKADAESLFFMGVGWEIDNGQPNDDVMACIWYRLAAHKGFKQGGKNCSWLSKEMTAAQITQTEEISRQLIEKTMKRKDNAKAIHTTLCIG